MSIMIFICSAASSDHSESMLKSDCTSCTSSMMTLKYLPLSMINVRGVEDGRSNTS